MRVRTCTASTRATPWWSWQPRISFNAPDSGSVPSLEIRLAALRAYVNGETDFEVDGTAYTMDEDGKIVCVTEDIRNGNGRAIKSKLWSPNRVDKIDAPVNAIFWIMKDPTIPPIVRLKGASLASVMGATLATKRSSAERLKAGVDPNALVVEPYANPFRTYPLVNDYEKFKKLVAEKNVACYIINTGDFMGKKVQKEDTLGILEAVVEGKANFKPWGPFSDIEILEWEGFVPRPEGRGLRGPAQSPDAGPAGLCHQAGYRRGRV